MARIYIQVRKPYWQAQHDAYMRLMRKSRKRRKKVLADRRLKSQERALEARRNPTPAEQAFIDLLNKECIAYVFQYVYFIDKYKFRIIDFYLPQFKMNVEIDGGYHDQEHVKAYDEYKDNRTPFVTERFKNEQVFEPQFFEKTLRPILNRRLEKLRIKDCRKLEVKRRLMVFHDEWLNG